MAYTSYEEMRAINRTRFGKDVGPFQPELFTEGGGFDMKSAALRFIREGCEELRFGEKSVEQEVQEGVYSGTAAKAGQVPYNMQMDTDRLCFEKALERFIDSGVAEDAYEVYYCYLEMFIGSYVKSKSMVELLSEFETNGSSLLMKHRDHYSHSVYVFTLGLAIYETNSLFRKSFMEYYGFGTDERDREAVLRANHLYLEFWGLTALFHDIGYPFELPFEQVMSYFEIDKNKRKPGIMYISYNSLEGMTDLTEPEQEHFRALYGKTFMSVCDLLAYDISSKLSESYGFSEGYLLRKIMDKPIHPENFSYFMDHAFFSAARLYRELVNTTGAERLGRIQVDALSAILMHNSLFKFVIAFYKSAPPVKKPPLKMTQHPLAFMLMLCDELQCWDRTSYGRATRSELFPMSADFDFSGGGIAAKYHYDSAEDRKIAAYYRKKQDFDNHLTDEKPRLKAYSDMTGKNSFVSEINDIVDLSEIPFTAVPDTIPADRSRKHTYLSSSSFIHMYDFAVALSARKSLTGDETELSLDKYYAKYDAMSLEYKVLNLRRAKSFSRYLNRIGCFYTDRPVDFERVYELTPAQMEVIAPMEHERWLKDHSDNGWTYGTDYETLSLESSEEESVVRPCLREQVRQHKLMIPGEVTPESALEHFLALPESEQDKDIEPMSSMLKLIQLLDGVKVYSLDMEM